MKGSKAFENDLYHFRQAAREAPNQGRHTHDFLIEAMEHYVNERREDTNRDARRAAHKLQMGITVEANAANDESEEKPKPKAPPRVESNSKAIQELTSALVSVVKQGSANSGGGLSTSVVPATGRGRSKEQATEPTEESSIEVWSAFVANNPKETLEFLDAEKGLKKDKVCIAHITKGCTMEGDCPNHHTKSKRICLLFNSSKGCTMSKCNYGHELIGGAACRAVMNWAIQKNALAKNDDKQWVKGKGKAAWIDEVQKGDGKGKSGKGGKRGKIEQSQTLRAGTGKSLVAYPANTETRVCSGMPNRDSRSERLCVTRN